MSYTCFWSMVQNAWSMANQERKGGTLEITFLSPANRLAMMYGRALGALIQEVWMFCCFSVFILVYTKAIQFHNILISHSLRFWYTYLLSDTSRICSLCFCTPCSRHGLLLNSSAPDFQDKLHNHNKHHIHIRMVCNNLLHLQVLCMVISVFFRHQLLLCISKGFCSLRQLRHSVFQDNVL